MHDQIRHFLFNILSSKLKAGGLTYPSQRLCSAFATNTAALLLAMEGLVFIWVHVKYAETTPIIMSTALSLLMLFIAYGRLYLKPIS